MITLTLPGEFCDFNTFQNKTRYNKFAGAGVKKSETERVYWECKSQKIKPVAQYPVTVSFKWYSKNTRKDVDNIAFAKKFILDGLVMAKVIDNDSQQFVKGFSDEFFVDKINQRVEIKIYGKKV